MTVQTPTPTMPTTTTATLYRPSPSSSPSPFSPGEDVARQLHDLERQGGGMASLAHICAGLLLAAFSAGSLISISYAAFERFLLQWAAGAFDLPDAISLAVNALLVLAADVGLLYAASQLRTLIAAGAPASEQRIHRWAMLGASALESATYLYLVWTFDRPDTLFLWSIGTARALAAPLFAAYLSMVRPIPVGPRDVAYQAALASGKGVVRDVATIAADPAAPLDRKVRIFRAASTMTSADRAKFDGIIDALAPHEEQQQDHEQQQEEPQPAPDTPAAPASEPQPPEPPEPPTPPRDRTAASPQHNGHDTTRSNAQDLSPVLATPPAWLPRADQPLNLTLNVRPPRPKAPRSDTGRGASEREQLRQKREHAAARILDQHPDTGPRELARRIAMMTSHRCSESTAAALRATILAARQPASNPSNLSHPSPSQATTY